MSNYKDPPPPYSPQYPAPGVHYGPPPPPPAPGYHAGPPPTTAYPPYYGPPPPQQGYGATTTTVIVENPEVIVIGACPACRVGVLQDGFTCLGLLCAILFFPIGILCCLALTEKRCSNCGANFS